MYDQRDVAEKPFELRNETTMVIYSTLVRSIFIFLHVRHFDLLETPKCLLWSLGVSSKSYVN